MIMMLSVWCAITEPAAMPLALVMQGR